MGVFVVVFMVMCDVRVSCRVGVHGCGVQCT